jgi:hypothetical protein
MESAIFKSRSFNTLNHCFREITNVALKHLLLSAGFATAVAGSAAQHVEAAVDSESAAQAEWRTLMAHNPMPVDGCFHASYPNIVWEKVDCNMSPPRVHPTHVRPTGDDAQETGNGHN